MLLGLLRDRAALAMGFALPVAFFLVFAAIFAGASGQHLRLKLAFADEVGSEASARLLRALARSPALDPVSLTPLPTARVHELVRSGAADAGLVVRAEAAPLGELGGLGAPPLLLLTDPTRAVASRVVEGLAQEAYFNALPDVALGGVVGLIESQLVELTPEQRALLSDEIAALREQALAAEARGETGGGASFAELVEAREVTQPRQGSDHVAYYAGAVAILFLLFSAVHGALSVLEERDSGVLDRVLAGPAGSAALIDGKFLFLVALGFVQVSVIFVVAWLLHGLDFPGRLGRASAVSLAAAAAAAGLALALTTSCRTRRQAQTLANMAILIVSAVGGSMVPRFFMPPWMRDLGWLTPNTWALEAWTAVFWRDAPAGQLALPLGLLALTAAAGLGIARAAARRWEQL
jgi:ABC-2 type transport system permease protein